MNLSQTKLKFFIYSLFFISGFCALLYQIVWIRLAYAHFGINTSVLSVVISVFMLGLALGSWLGGKYISSLAKRFSISAIYLYAIIEFCVGLSAVAVPWLFKIGESYLLSVTAASDDAAYLAYSAAAICLAVIPWTFLMGLTYPVMTAFLKERFVRSDSAFSFLYTANTVGAMLGTAVTAVILIEALGFKQTLAVAMIANFLIAAAAIMIERSKNTQEIAPQNEQPQETAVAAISIPSSSKYVLAVLLFITGLVSLALEVIWTRAFIPIISVEVYSFAFLLFAYLFATWIGSIIYRVSLRHSIVISIQSVVSFVLFSIFLIIILGDPRINISFYNAFGIYGVALGILPFCALLGYSTPMLIDQMAQGSPAKIGRYYAINTIGCIIGPLTASYLLLPFFSIKHSILILSLPFFAVIAFLLKERLNKKFILFTIGNVLVLFLVFFVSKGYEEVFVDKVKATVFRDHTATVMSFGTGQNKSLLINGIPITAFVPVTKVMAHLPLAVFGGAPKNALVICFGMGTTFRSINSWGVNATGIDLVPSVPKVFPFYFADAEQIMRDPKNRIVVDDGRRFLARTREKYDVITLDPPPPVSAAGSSLLYSSEFYVLAKTRLSENGILQQWLPPADLPTLAAVTRSLVNNFKYVKMFAGADGGGHHFLASDHEIKTPSPAKFVSLMPEQAKKDLVEWNEGKYKNPEEFATYILSKELSYQPLLEAYESVSITDNRPFNEYYLLRHFFD